MDGGKRHGRVSCHPDEASTRSECCAAGRPWPFRRGGPLVRPGTAHRAACTAHHALFAHSCGRGGTVMGDGRRPGSGGKEHLGQGGRGPRLKGGMLAAGLLLATGALAATTASSTAGASRGASGGIALSASKPMGHADAGARGASAKALVGQGPQRLTGGAIPLTALKGVSAPREGLQVAAATRSATGVALAGHLAGATQVALLDWPRTDTGGRAPISARR